MKINFLPDNKVEVIFEVNAIYKRPTEERRVYKTAFIINEFDKIHPEKTIVNTLSTSQVDNFSSHGIKKGTWIFELENKKPPPVVKKMVPEKRIRKKIAKRLVEE